MANAQQLRNMISQIYFPLNLNGAWPKMPEEVYMKRRIL
jgi:hypothetical protein